MSILIFAYGSLINPQSRKKTLQNSKLIADDIILNGYSRKMNAPYRDEGYLYLNIVPKDNSKVEGVVIEVDDSEIEKLKKREEGYNLIEITNKLSRNLKNKVFTFVQPDKYYPEMKVLQSYINTCIKNISKENQKEWLEETIIENEILNDTINPFYEFKA